MVSDYTLLQQCQKTGQWELPFYQNHRGSFSIFRIFQSWSLSGPGTLPTPRVRKFPKYSVLELRDRAVFQSR